MKTLIEKLTVSLAIYSGLLILIAGIAFGADLSTNPPSTDASAAGVFVMEDEDYIDDIPFSTEAVVENYKASESMKEIFDYEEEAYIDDIPFDTEAIAENVRLNNARNTVIDFEDEAYVNDIPFNTAKVAGECADNMLVVK